MRSASGLAQRDDRFREHVWFVRTASAVDVELIDRLAAARQMASARRESHRLHSLRAIDSQAMRDRGRIEDPSRDTAEGGANVRAAVGGKKEDDAAPTARPADFSGPRTGVGRRFDRGIN